MNEWVHRVNGWYLCWDMLRTHNICFQHISFHRFGAFLLELQKIILRFSPLLAQWHKHFCSQWFTVIVYITWYIWWVRATDDLLSLNGLNAPSTPISLWTRCVFQSPHACSLIHFDHWQRAPNCEQVIVVNGLNEKRDIEITCMP